MPTYLLCHRHDSAECGPAYAAWKGFDSPLRHQEAIASCAYNGHQIWWTVDAVDPDGAVSLLPGFVARRTEVVTVTSVKIP
jgi:hypothetical protein